MSGNARRDELVALVQRHGLYDHPGSRARGVPIGTCPRCGKTWPIGDACDGGCQPVAIAAALEQLAGGNGAGENGAGAKETLRRLDVAEMARSDPPPVPWVVEGLVVRGMLTALHGQPGEGKSLLAQALAAGVATGQGEAGLVCHEGGVVVVDAENGPYEIHRRVRTLDLPDLVAMYEADGFDLRRNLDELEAELAEVKPSLLVLDSFRSLWGGDENDSGEVAAALDPLRNLVRRYDVGTLLVHHSGKGNGAYRGSSAIAASVELGFKLARDPDDSDRNRRYLECWKCRPAPEPEQRWLRLAVEGGRVFIDEADPPAGQEPDTATAPVREALRPRLIAALTAEPQSRADLARAVGRDAKDRSVGRVLDALEVEAIAEKSGPESRPKWHLAEGGSPNRPPKGSCHLPPSPATPLPERENEGGSPPATFDPPATFEEPPQLELGEGAG